MTSCQITAYCFHWPFTQRDRNAECLWGMKTEWAKPTKVHVFLHGNWAITCDNKWICVTLIFHFTKLAKLDKCFIDIHDKLSVDTMSLPWHHVRVMTSQTSPVNQLFVQQFSYFRLTTKKPALPALCVGHKILVIRKVCTYNDNVLKSIASSSFTNFRIPIYIDEMLPWDYEFHHLFLIVHLYYHLISETLVISYHRI